MYIYYWTGLSACMIGKLDIGEKYLKIAAENGMIEKEGRPFLNEMDYFKKAWEDEQKIRAAEAAANDLAPRALENQQGRYRTRTLRERGAHRPWQTLFRWSKRAFITA